MVFLMIFLVVGIGAFAFELATDSGLRRAVWEYLVGY
jgi:hypothetical protein